METRVHFIYFERWNVYVAFIGDSNDIWAEFIFRQILFFFASDILIA